MRRWKMCEVNGAFRVFEACTMKAYCQNNSDEICEEPQNQELMEACPEPSSAFEVFEDVPNLFTTDTVRTLR